MQFEVRKISRNRVMLIQASRSQKLRAKIGSSFLLLSLITSMVTINKLANCAGVDHCYSDLGCFPLSEEFYHPRHRPFNVRPWHRSRIKTQFEIYNPKHPQGFMLNPWDKENLLISGFDPRLETKIIIPGWLDSIKRTVWFKRMKDAFQYYWRPVNVIAVYWRNFTPYTIATANTRVVGAELANLIKFLEHELNYDRAYYHLIGHSLGAHISGYCGDRMPGLGRITALDPARPFFQHMPKSVRLDRNDAKFVDAIHSDFTPENAIFLLMSFGMTTPVGHVDFYPNGPPLLQPGCLRDTLMSVRNGIQRGLQHSSLSIAFLEAVRYLTACDHQRSHEWFTESILNRQCVFVGVRCNEFEGMINGRCTCDDSPSSCAIMGIHADQMFMNGVHEDLWPRGHKSRNNRPIARPFVARREDNYNKFGLKDDKFNRYKRMFVADYLDDERPTLRPLNRDQIYASFKHQSEQLRKPREPQNIEGLEGMEDGLFVEYLRNNLLIDQPNNNPDLQASIESHPLRAPSLNHDSMANFQALFHQQANFPFNQHPKLMSDLDRDIDDWYENTSRWYLKTNNRPNYCVNQYQVLVYLGPLKSTNGKERLRANLLISIIGSRGQLINQRFVPRAQQLDSFTMQPFFILLEGSYSLGNILSVAIGWEQRYDPDPIQATVSFQSNLLQNLEANWPINYKAKHPWLSETLKYDHSPGFRWTNHRLPQLSGQSTFGVGGTASQLLSNIGVELSKRSSFDDDVMDANAHDISSSECSTNIEEGEEVDQCSAPKLSQSPNLDLKSNLLNLDKFVDELNIMESIENYHVLADTTKTQEQYTPSETSSQLHQQVIDLMSAPTVAIPHQLLRSPQMTQFQHQTLQSHRQRDSPEVDGGHITVDFHNINLNEDLDSENTIVINEVVIIPLQASYGKYGPKTSKTFCPPHGGFHLRKDQTVKLTPNLIGKCNPMKVPKQYHHSHIYHRYHQFKPQPIR